MTIFHHKMLGCAMYQIFFSIIGMDFVQIEIINPGTCKPWSREVLLEKLPQ